MTRAPLRILATPEDIGDELATRLLRAIDAARARSRRFLLACPTGRTPKPIYAAMARRLRDSQHDLSQLVLVMMDEYLERDGAGFRYVPDDAPWSCHRFTRVEIAAQLNTALSPERRLSPDAIWFPDPRRPAAYDERIADAGGIDFFLLASGASDGHVGFNPPGSARDTRTCVVELSAETRRDNLRTFPELRDISRVPTHGVTVGIDTITRAREAVMVAWGEGKRVTLERMRAASTYDPAWPATVIHACARGEIVSDRAAATSVAG